MKQLSASCCLSLVATWLAAGSFSGGYARAQEVQASQAPAAQSIKPMKAADNGNQATRDSQPAKPEPLSGEEAAKLEARSQEPGPDVAGGALSNLHLTYIVIALAAAVIVLIAK